MKHNFQRSLAIGHAGEVAFLAIYPGLTRLGGKGADFIDEEGRTYELKVDSYDMSTGNFFIERYSNAALKSPGSFWQSKADIFIYHYPKNKTYFVFTPDAALLVTLDDLLLDLYPIKIQNTSWTTIGFKVPRELLKQYYQEVKYV